MKSFTIAVALGSFAVVGAAHAQQAAYVWTGMGQNVTGSSKCTSYKMEIDLTVDGNAVKGLFQQEGRDQRHFEAVADGKGAFKTKAQVGQGNSMDVTGSIKDGTVLLDGYCKFGGKLTKK